MKHILLVALASWSLLAPFVFYHVPKDSRRTFSEHIATGKMTILAGMLGICVTALAILIWYFTWYAPGHGNALQAILISIVAIAAMFVGAIPFRENTMSGQLHVLSAWTYAILLLPLGVTFIITANSAVAGAVIGLLLVWQIVTLSLYLFYKPSRRYFLYYQLSYISAFALVLLTATYIGA